MSAFHISSSLTTTTTTITI